MAYDRKLAARLREVLAGQPDLSEKAMFGGLAFLVDGHMAVAGGSDGIMVRVDPERSEALLDDGAERMVMNGRELAGWLRVSGEN
ncbi:MAG: TfoX/Sxy family protein, partial [Nakamurella sp.]